MKIIELKDKVLEVESCYKCPLTYDDWHEDFPFECCSVVDVQGSSFIPKKGFREDCPLKEGDKVRV